MNSSRTRTDILPDMTRPLGYSVSADPRPERVWPPAIVLSLKKCWISARSCASASASFGIPTYGAFVKGSWSRSKPLKFTSMS